LGETIVSFRNVNKFRIRSLCWPVCIAALALSGGVAAEQQPKSPPDLSGVWAVFQTVTPSGLRAMADPPMSKQGRELVETFRNQFNLEGMEPNAYCVEPGMPTVMYGVGNQPIEIVQSPKRVTIISEVGMQYRRIFVDGRKHPQNYPNTRNGHSVGRWEGDTFVVETTLIEEWLMPRWAHTGNARTVERFSLKKSTDIKLVARGNYNDPGRLGEYVLVDELTMYDAAIYDTPPSITVYYRKLPEEEFLEHNCAEGLWWDVMEKLRK
jgi:hypothetical protein